jgi:hypothetical protein
MTGMRFDKLSFFEQTSISPQCESRCETTRERYGIFSRFRSEIAPLNPRNPQQLSNTELARDDGPEESQAAGQRVKEYPMSQTVLDRTAEHIAESAHQASRATSAVADAIGSGVAAVRRAVKLGSDAEDEFLNDTTQRVQRYPLLTVATTFAVGFTAGAFLSWMIKGK